MSNKTTREGPPPESEWSKLPKTRAEAVKAESRFYFTGSPCAHGHVAPKRTSNYTCVLCEVGHKAKWYDANARPKADAARAQREAERPAREAARKAKLEAERPARLAAQREKRKQRMRDEGTEEVRAEEALAVKEAYWSNPTKARARVHERRVKGLVSTIAAGYPSIHVLRTPPGLSEEERAAIERFYAERPEGHHVDHIVPLIHPMLAGLHVLANIQYLPSTKSQSKGNRVEYTQEEAEALVARGVAVWAKHTDGGWVQWEHYPDLAGDWKPVRKKRLKPTRRDGE